ncbi:hypothetical protein [Archaeoglobus neptunius]|uniref:hypothetical protein n=1 Tax=Archaeoglobus neptunius TaxID=2798580 RepID=UPI001928D1A5|nr:hypothetical protein [Archaeoglobus neptunius]
MPNRILAVVIFLLLLLAIGYWFSSSFFLQFLELKGEWHYEIKAEGDVRNLTLMIPMVEIKNARATLNPNVSIVETEYGKMVRTRVSELDSKTLVYEISMHKVFDIFNATLNCERELISKSKEETCDNCNCYNWVYKIRCPIYADYDGDGSVRVELWIHSGQKFKPVFFTFTLPDGPFYKGKHYSGHRFVSFIVNSTGYAEVEGEDKTYACFVG